MLIDLAETGTAPASLRAEVCIVGGGIAGLLLADRLATYGIDVLLLEAGGMRPTAEAETKVDSGASGIEAAYGDDWRGSAQALGGASLVWGGQLLPARTLQNWPVGVAQLAPYLPPVEQLTGVDAFPYEADAFFRELQEPHPPSLASEGELQVRLSKFSPFSRRNLARSLGVRLRNHPRAQLILHATAEEVAVTTDGQRASRVLARSASGQPVPVEAQHFVVAAGTVESVRLLLSSRSLMDEGLGNAHGQLGRHFHNHVTVEAAWWDGPARAEMLRTLRPWVVGGANGTLHALKWEASVKLQAQLGISPAMAHLTWEEPPGSGAGALRDVLRDRQGGGGHAVLKFARRAPEIAVDVLRFYRDARFERRRYLSPRARISLRLNLAQPRSSCGSIDLKQPQGAAVGAIPRVNWRATPEDVRALRSFAAHLRTIVQQTGGLLSRGLRWREDVLPESAEKAAPDAPMAGLEDARHAMGGACMGTDLRSSVVDPDLRVHGLANLWIASAATFPDGEPQLPTLTLMQLTLRLADRLRAELEKGRR